MSELFRPFGPAGTSKGSRRRACRPWFYGDRDPQWEAPLDPDPDPIDKDGFTPHERRQWLWWLGGWIRTGKVTSTWPDDGQVPRRSIYAAGLR